MSQAQLLQFPDQDTVERTVNAFIFDGPRKERQVRLQIVVKVLPAEEYDELVFDNNLSKFELVDEILVSVLTPIGGSDGSDEPLPPEDARARVLNNQRMMTAIFDDYVTLVQSRDVKGKNSNRRRGR